MNNYITVKKFGVSNKAIFRKLFLENELDNFLFSLELKANYMSIK